MQKMLLVGAGEPHEPVETRRTGLLQQSLAGNVIAAEKQKGGGEEKGGRGINTSERDGTVDAED